MSKFVGIRALVHSKRERKRLLFYAIMIALPLLQVGIFYFGVNINSILLAFKEYDSATGEYSWAGFEHFAKVLDEFIHDPSATWRYAFLNSFVTWIITASVNMILALFFSYYIFKKGIGKNFFRVMLFMPSIVSSIIMVVLFSYFVDSFIPEIVFKYFGKEMRGMLSNPDLTMFMLILYSIITGFGTNVLLLSSAMSSISDSVVEAAQIDGCNRFQEFIHVVFPSIYPTFVTILIVSIAGLFSNQMNLFSFYGMFAEVKFSTVGYILYKRTVQASYSQYPDLAAIGILITLIIVPLTLGSRKILEKVGPKYE